MRIFKKKTFAPSKRNSRVEALTEQLTREMPSPDVHAQGTIYGSASLNEVLVGENGADSSPKGLDKSGIFLKPNAPDMLTSCGERLCPQRIGDSLAKMDEAGRENLRFAVLMVVSQIILIILYAIFVRYDHRDFVDSGEQVQCE